MIFASASKTSCSNNSSRKVIIYTRVSTNNQKDNLLNQVNFLQNFINANGIIVDEIIQDIGSGLNYKRKKWNELLDEVMENKIDMIIVSNKDRFIRFGFEWFESFADRHGCKIIIMNQESLSPTEEVTQDLLAIIHCFSSRLYGLRKYKDKVKELVSSKE